MGEPTRIDLTAVDGAPGVRAEIRIELKADDLAARRLRGQQLVEHQLRTDPPTRRPDSGPQESPAASPRRLAHQSADGPLIARAVHRSILAVDIEGSTKRTNFAKAQLRHTMYGLLEIALRAAGMGEQVRDKLVDRGDGALVLIHPSDEVPKALLLDTVVPTLSGLLLDHNRHSADLALRLRAVIHAGEVHFDGRGWFGETLDLAFRLLDAPSVKRRLFYSTWPLVLVVSDDIYRSIVAQGYNGIDQHSYERSVRVRVGEHRHVGWMQTTDQAAVGPVEPTGPDDLAPPDEPASGIA